jgi:hypothetical protein
VDRLAKVFSGRNYGFNDTDASMATFALYNWSPAAAPVNIVFIQAGRFQGSGFPSNKWDHAFVSESGPTWADGPQPRGKRISEFVLSAAGGRLSGPTPLVEYNGTGKATVAALAAGPDGLYFSDLYPDQNFTSPVQGGANILRLSWGTAAPNLPPVVTLYSPSDGSAFTAPTNLNLSATPSDANGIAKVEFYAGTLKLGEITAAPYVFTWTNVGSGSYALTARALDTTGLWGTSAVVNITVSAPVNPALLIAGRSAWKYLDDGSNQGTNWISLGYNDAGWSQGLAPLGYGDGDEATVVRSNRTDNTRIITTYYRKSFSIPTATNFGALFLRLLRDDGAVVYLNGKEIYRDNMPGGTIGYSTLAVTNVSGGQESTNYVTATVSSAALRAGNNVIAVEIHQVLANDSDTSFDLEATGLPAIRLRNPARTASGFPTFQVNCATGVVCYIELSTDLLSWKSIFTNRPTVSPWTFQESLTNKGTQFYRGKYAR